jgi:nucleoside-diphosphate-sugar epimerase
MSTYLIIGAGAIGSAVAEQLADQGHRVRVMTRSASGPRHPSIELVGADATDGDRGDLQLRQSRVSQVVDRLAADRRRDP